MANIFNYSSNGLQFEVEIRKDNTKKLIKGLDGAYYRGLMKIGMPDYITTYTGLRFSPTAPETEKICIEDIAHALSMLCRGNGHVRTFFSVGQHCILCAKEAAARGLGDRLVLACLLHDAGECYMSDVPRPIKKSMPEYIAQEDALLEVIYTKYLGAPLTETEQRQLREIDDALLYYDLRDLLGEKQNCDAPCVSVEIDRSFRPFEEVEREYLEIFHCCFDKIKGSADGYI